MPIQLKRREVLAASLAFPALSASANADNGVSCSRETFDRRLRPTVSTGTERWSLTERMAHYRVPGVAIAILRGGRLEQISGYGSRVAGQPQLITPETLFSVGSVSKLATAALCLRLVALGHIKLDEDVGRQLVRWRVPPGPQGDSAAITLRMLLSHTAGFNVHGFRDFAPDEPLPTLIQILNGAAPAKNPPLARANYAGSRSRYSGGGYMVAQALAEDATGLPFDALAKQFLFDPLGMSRSSFSASLSPERGDIAHAHDATGKAAALPRGWQSFPELAASGLWSCTADLARFIAALGASYRGAKDPFLPRKLAAEMMTPVSPGTHGLGPRLAGEGAASIFHHGGSNESYKSYVEGNLASGDGLVVLTNGSNGDSLGDEIRNAVSDTMAWPGDWSVITQSMNDSELLDAYAGKYRKRESQSLELAGLLDTSFDADRIEIVRNGDQLEMKANGRTRSLAALTSNSFVVPDTYVPAGVLQLNFKRGADRIVRSLIISGGGTLQFERI